MRVAAAGAPRQRARQRRHAEPTRRRLARAGAGAARRERAQPPERAEGARACLRRVCAPQLLLGARVRLNLRGEDRVVVGNGASGDAREVGRPGLGSRRGARRRAVPVGERRRRVRRRRRDGGVAEGVRREV